MNEVKKESNFSKAKTEIQFTITSFEQLETECNEVIKALEEDSSLEKFRIEYEKLFMTLKKTCHQEKQLVEKCQELNDELSSNAGKVKDIINRSRRDQSTIHLLKQDAEKAWSLVNANRTKEHSISQTVDKLQDEVSRLCSQLEQERTRVMQQDENCKKIALERDKLKVQYREGSGEIITLEKTVSDMDARIEKMNTKMSDLREANGALTDEICTTNKIVEKEQRKCERYDREKIELKLKYEKKTSEYIDLEYTESSHRNKAEHTTKELNETKRKLEDRTNESEELTQKIKQLTESLALQKDKMSAINEDSRQCKRDLKLVQEGAAKITSEKAQIQRKFDSEHKTVLRLQQVVDDTKSSSHASQREIQSIKRELDDCRKREEDSSRQNGVLEREKNINLSKIQRTEEKVRRANEDAFHNDQAILSLEKELASAKEETGRLKRQLRNHGQVFKQQNTDMVKRSSTIDGLHDEARVREIEMEELQKQLRQWESKFKEQSQICNNLQVERGKASRKAIEAHSELEKLKSKGGGLNNEVKKLRNDLSTKEEHVLKTQFELKQERAKNEHRGNELSRLRQQILQQESLAQKQDSEICRLSASLRKMDSASLVQKKDYDQVINERDILGTQLIRRNDELALMHEKVKIQENSLKTGELQYQERLEDIRQFKLKTLEIQRELNTRKEGSTDSDELTKELAQKDQELLKEKIKVKALSEEIEKPLNLHRWRKLEGTDPTSLELNKKIDLLQKRLIKKTEEVSASSVYQF
jgi:chromosome segregation ATPase